MRIDKLYDLTGFILNKEQFGKRMKRADFNNLAEFVMYDVIKQRYGLPEAYAQQGIRPMISWETTQKITDDLKHLKIWYGGKDYPLLSVNSSGEATIPTNYLHYSSIRKEYQKDGQTKYSEIEVLFDNEIGDRLTNPNRTPSKKYPVCVFYDTFIQFYPKNIGYIHFTYLRKPLAPYYATTTATVNGEDVETYDSANSTQLELPEDMHFDFVRLMLQHFAINLRSGDVFQYAQQQKQQGL